MNAKPAVARPSRRTAAWWLHCLLVMLLVFDQVSSPLHRHHHDNGPDAASGVPGQLHAEHVAGHDLDDDEEAPAGHHATGVPRSEASTSGQAADTGPDAASAIGSWMLAVWLADLAPAARPVWPLAFALDHPPRPVPLSRPPDGRAPPVRA
ncbi:MAG TPA: hypothetical protein PLO41_09415 [Rubrivivax sp.]|nr:hypothetical protein [Rubrivivax sp.]